jgi:hypothetical protein
MDKEIEQIIMDKKMSVRLKGSKTTKRGSPGPCGPHPTTGDKDYTEDEVEFMMAVQNYIKLTGHKFPTCSEMLHIVITLGYIKIKPEVLNVPKRVLTAS